VVIAMNLVGKGSGYGKEPRSRLLGMVLGDLGIRWAARAMGW